MGPAVEGLRAVEVKRGRAAFAAASVTADVSI